VDCSILPLSIVVPLANKTKASLRSAIELVVQREMHRTTLCAQSGGCEDFSLCIEAKRKLEEWYFCVHHDTSMHHYWTACTLKRILQIEPSIGIDLSALAREGELSMPKQKTEIENDRMIYCNRH